MTVDEIGLLWWLAFGINMMIGFIIMCGTIHQSFPKEYLRALWWTAWWSFASAFTLLLSIADGPNNPFSYHQIGILTETMENFGMFAFVYVYLAEQRKVCHANPKQGLFRLN